MARRCIVGFTSPQLFSFSELIWFVLFYIYPFKFPNNSLFLTELFSLFVYVISCVLPTFPILRTDNSLKTSGRSSIRSSMNSPIYWPLMNNLYEYNSSTISHFPNTVSLLVQHNYLKLALNATPLSLPIYQLQKITKAMPNLHLLLYVFLAFFFLNILFILLTELIFLLYKDWCYCYRY